MPTFKIAVLEGDGIGPEVVSSAIKVLKKIGELAGVDFAFEKALIGGCAIDQKGTPLPQETVDLCLNSDAVLLGAVGGPKWDDLPTDKRPEKGLLGIRKALDLYANLRPAKVYEPLISSSPLKEEVARGTDFIVVRELTGDVYYGEPRGIFVENGKRVGINTMRYTEDEIRRVVRKAFEVALQRKKKLTSVDKSNVLEVSGLWKSVAEEKSLRELPTEALSKVMEVSKEIVKTTAEIGEKALRVVRYSVEGAVEGAKKALKEEEEKKEGV